MEAKKIRYETWWRNKWLTSEAKTLTDMAETFESTAKYFREMIADGVELDPEGGTADDYAVLVTYDPEVAKKYDLQEPDDEDDEDDEEAEEDDEE